MIINKPARLNLFMSIAMAAVSLSASARDIERQLHFVVTIDAQQTWKKNDPQYPGDQYSKATSKHRYEVTTRLRSDGKLELRNLLDPDLNTRLEAKTIFLARQVLKMRDASGKPYQIPRTPAEEAAMTRRMQEETVACKAEPACLHAADMRNAIIFAAMQYPEALQEETEPGTFLYFVPFRGCLNQSRVTLELQIDGVRYNKTSDKLVPFSEHHSADTVNASDGLELCDHYTAVIDTADKAKLMYQETLFVPRPLGVTTYTESGHTSTTTEPQPIITAVLDWLGETLRHAPMSGSTAVTLPLPLPLNSNATWLGLWTGTAKVNLQWSFTDVPAAPSQHPNESFHDKTSLSRRTSAGGLPDGVLRGSAED